MGSISKYIKKQGGLWAVGPVDILFFVCQEMIDIS